jgi:hypothetical protein
MRSPDHIGRTHTAAERNLRFVADVSVVALKRLAVRGTIVHNSRSKRYAGMAEERTFLRDSEWASIDGDLCLVTEFVPLAGRIENGSVVAFDSSTPYASVQLKNARYGDITGFITHKVDFAMLWAAFNNERGHITGAYREFGLHPSELGGSGEEVWLVWTRKRYRGLVRLLPKGGLPKLIVMVAAKGAFESLADEPNLIPFAPMVTWIPEVMVRHLGDRKLQQLPAIWEAIQSEHSK